MADFALPQSLSISDVKRNSMPAVRRTVLHGSTSQNTYGPGELVYIPVDTGTSGSFFDPSTSRLDMTVNVYNKNYFVDFFSLPRCGFHAIIEEFGIEIHNSLHENQRFYAEMIESEMIRHGENPIPYELTVSNPHEVGGGNAGEMHINLVKPSMVTTVGLPHGVQYAVMQQPTGSNMSSSVANVLSEGILLNAHPYLKKVTGRNGHGEITQENVVTNYDGSITHVSATAGRVGVYTDTLDLTNKFGWWAESNLPATSTYDDRIPKNGVVNWHYETDLDVAVENASTSARVYGNPTATRTDALHSSIKSGSGFAQDNQIFSSNRFIGDACAIAPRYSKIIPRVDPTFGLSKSDNTMWDVSYGQTVGGYTPMMWPAKQPCDLEKLFAHLKYARKGVNTKNIQNYYANCKNISCAIPVNLSGDDIYGEKNIWGSKEHSLPEWSDRSKGQKYSFRVSLKLYSCLFGVYARKFFPSLLIGAGRVRIRMRLQQPNVLFQTLMDPCRVVPGTGRDRFPYQGVFKTSTVAISALRNAPVSDLCHAVHPILITNYQAGACFNDMVATGRFPVPQTRMKALNAPLTLSNAEYGTYMTAVNARKVNLLDYGIAAATSATDYGHGSYAFNESQRQLCEYGHPSLYPASNTAPTFHSKVCANAAPSGVAAASLTPLQVNAITAQNIEEVYKTLSDLVVELTRNTHYGYPPHFIKYIHDHATAPVIPVISLEKDKDATQAIALDQGYLDTGVIPTPSSSIGCFQNYSYHTDPINLVGASQKTYTAGGYHTTQAIFPEWQTTTQLTSDHFMNGLNWDPFAYPLPQYIPTKNPWNKLGSRVLTSEDFINEREVCYGTYLPRSVAQVRRTNKNLYPLSMDAPHSPGITEGLTYTVSNIVYRVEEIILPESASLQIIASAMEGGITMEASTVKTIEQILQKQDNQKILLNVSAGIVDDICFLFQPTEMFQGQKAYGYNSFAFYCPWTSFQFVPQTETTTGSGVSVPQSPEDYNYLGGEPQYYNGLIQSDNISISTFLSIATEYFPRNPINDLQTLLDHVTWGDQRRGDVEYLGLEPMIHNTYDTSNFTTIIPFQDGFFSVFTPIETLNDQTITCNPFFTPIECNIKRLIRGKRAKKPALPFFKPLDGTFHLAFNLQAFMGQHDRMNVGTPMVNNNSYLQMQQCHLLREFETRMLTLIRCFARIVIERGGIVQIFT